MFRGPRGLAAAAIRAHLIAVDDSAPSWVSLIAPGNSEYSIVISA